MATTSWNLDTTHSHIGFSVRHMVFAKVRGRFAQWQGTVQLDPEDLSTAVVDVEIDADSIDTGVADRDNHLKAADFFNVDSFPKLRFKSTRVEASADKFLVHGELTIRDVTRDIVLDAEFGGQAADPWGNQRVAFAASTSVDRRDYGLTWNQALETGGVLVGERIDIDIDVQAVQSAETKAA